MKKILIFLFSLFAFFFCSTSSIWAKASLSLNPSSSKAKTWDVISFELKLSTTEIIEGVDLKLSFNPNFIEINNVKAGGFLTNPSLLANSVDKKNGTIIFSVFTYPGKSGEGILLTFEAKILKEIISSLQLKIEPSSIIAGENGKKVEFVSATALIESLAALSPKPSPNNAPSTPVVTINPTATATSSGATKPTIMVENSPTPEFTAATVNSPNFLPKVAAFLILVGVLILIVQRKLGQNA